MELKTKYNIGDEVWYLYSFDEKLYKKKEPISRINISISTTTVITYSFDCEYAYYPVEKNETEIFSTKEQLLEYLRRE